MIRLALVDDHNLVRESLAQIIDSMPGISVVFQAGNGCEFLKKLRDTYIDMVLLDLQMPILDGFKTCDILHKEYPDMKIMALSQFTDQDQIREIFRLGAHGYASKKLDIDTLGKAIIKLHNEGFFFEEKQEDLFFQDQREIIPSDHPISISEREREIILLSTKGMSSKEIAQQLNISFRTVEVHKRNLMERLHCKNFIGVVVYALSYKIIIL